MNFKKAFNFLGSDVIKIAQGSFQLFTAEVISLLLSFIHGIVVARYLNAEGYGVLTLVVVYVTVVNQLVDFRIREAVVKFGAEFVSQKDQLRQLAYFKLCYILDFSTGVLAFLIVFLTAGWAARYIFHLPETFQFIRFYALVLLISTVDGASQGILTLFERFRWLSFAAVFSAGLKLLTVVIFVSMDFGLEGLLLAYLIAAFGGSIFLLVLALKTIKGLVWDKALLAPIGVLRVRFKEIFFFLLNTNLNETLSLFIRNVDCLLLGYFRPAAEVGYFRMAKNIGECLHIINLPVATALYPHLAYLFGSRKPKEAVSLLKKLSFALLLLILPLALFIFFTAPWLVPALLGEKFYPAVSSLRIILWGIFIAGIFLWLRPTFLALGRPGILTTINIFNVLIMLFLSIILVPRWGYIGSSLIYVFPYAFGHLAALFFLRRNWPEEKQALE